MSMEIWKFRFEINHDFILVPPGSKFLSMGVQKVQNKDFHADWREVPMMWFLVDPTRAGEEEAFYYSVIATGQAIKKDLGDLLGRLEMGALPYIFHVFGQRNRL